MIAAIKDDLSERIDNLGLVSACGLAIRGEVYAGQSGEEQIKQSLKSLVKPYGMPLVGVGFIYFDRRDVVRHKLVKDIIDAYEKFDDENGKN